MKGKTPVQLMEQTNAWIEKNPKMWDAFQLRARTAAANRRSWSARGIAEAIRWDGKYKRAEGEDFKVPNAITPVLGRYVVALYPETEFWFKKAKSKVDTLNAVDA